jgi:hypothetical protein
VRSLAAAAAAALSLVAAGCGGVAIPVAAPAPAAVRGSWTVTVAVHAPAAGPLMLLTGPLRPAPASDARPWLRHTLVFRNTGDRPITFADTRRSAFLRAAGATRLIAADDGCGYARSGRRGPVEAGACLLYLDAFTVPTGGSVTRTVTLFRGLHGMGPLRAGTYVFAKMLRFAVGRRPPADGAGSTVAVRLVYRVSP